MLPLPSILATMLDKYMEVVDAFEKVESLIGLHVKNCDFIRGSPSQETMNHQKGIWFLSNSHDRRGANTEAAATWMIRTACTTYKLSTFETEPEMARWWWWVAAVIVVEDMLVIGSANDCIFGVRPYQPPTVILIGNCRGLPVANVISSIVEFVRGL